MLLSKITITNVRMTWRGAQCYCPIGQKPAGSSCVDTNECENNVCDQICQVFFPSIHFISSLCQYVLQIWHTSLYTFDWHITHMSHISHITEFSVAGHCGQLHLLLCSWVSNWYFFIIIIIIMTLVILSSEIHYSHRRHRHHNDHQVQPGKALHVQSHQCSTRNAGETSLSASSTTSWS